MKWRHCGSPPLLTGSDPPRVKGSDAPQARHSAGTDSDGSDRDAPTPPSLNSQANHRELAPSPGADSSLLFGGLTRFRWVTVHRIGWNVHFFHAYVLPAR